MADMAFKEFSSLGGCDIHASFGNVKFADLQMIRYATNREKGQVWTLGSPAARATARGKRSVSGACVFTMIDRDNLVKNMTQSGSNNQIFISHDEMANYANYDNQISQDLTPQQQQAFRSGGSLATAGLVGGTQFNPFVSKNIFDASNFGVTRNAYLADQLLPFDITVVGIPEYGYHAAKRMIIHGVEFTSSASGTSIDDLVIEQQMAFIAKHISEWMPLDEVSITGTGGNG